MVDDNGLGVGLEEREDKGLSEERKTMAAEVAFQYENAFSFYES